MSGLFYAGLYKLSNIINPILEKHNRQLEIDRLKERDRRVVRLKRRTNIRDNAGRPYHR